METVLIQVTASVGLSFDRNSSEFQNALASYREYMDPKATENDMLCGIAKSVALNGHRRCVEGVGLVSYYGVIPEDSYCGVMVEPGYDDFECDVL